MALVSNLIAGSEAQRVLLLVHGYGADERDLGGLLTYLDPDGVFAAVLPRGPLRGARSARVLVVRDVRRRRRPEGPTQTSLAELDDLLDEQCAALGFDRAEAIVGGFSQGAGLALALALQRERPAAPGGRARDEPVPPALDGLDVDDAAVGRSPCSCSTAPTTR